MSRVGRARARHALCDMDVERAPACHTVADMDVGRAPLCHTLCSIHVGRARAYHVQYTGVYGTREHITHSEECMYVANQHVTQCAAYM